jgi:hypothetical protein
MKEHEIRALYDTTSITVYQAYSPAIALPAIEHNRFVPPFSLNRMTWIKPSFLWLMERSSWAQKAGQEMILAIRITQQGWEEALSQAVLTSYHEGGYRDYADWETQMKEASVRVQWDPERTLNGGKLEGRSIQVGLSRHVIEQYVNTWTLGITDVTPLVKKIYKLRQEGQTSKAKDFLPREKVYTLPAEIARRIALLDAPGRMG